MTLRRPHWAAASLWPSFLIAGLFALTIWRFYEPGAFGIVHDDAVLVGGGKSLAEGEGYRLASWPGAISQTKYPPGYPWLISLVWRFFPDFPVNLAAIYALGIGCGLAYLAGCRVWLTRAGLSPTAATGLTAVCAVHPAVAVLSTVALSDMPSATVGIWTAVIAERALDSRAPRRVPLWLAACCLAGCAILVRTLGLAFLLALGVVLWRRRGEARALLALLLGIPAAAAAWWTHYAVSHAVPIAADAPLGYVYSLTYAQSYLRFWIESVPSLDVFFRMVWAQLTALIVEPATLSFRVQILGVSFALSVWIVAGMVRRYRESGATVLDWALLPTVVVAALWNFPITGRVLVPFLPIFLLATAEQFGRLFSVLRAAAQSRDTASRILAGVHTIGSLGLVALSAYVYLAVEPESHASSARAYMEQTAAREELYRWARQSTRSDQIFITADDGLFYLNTGRPAASTILTTDTFYEAGDAALESKLPHLADTANVLHASFWVDGPDEYRIIAAKRKQRLMDATKALLADRQVAFETSDGSIRVYAWASGQPRRDSAAGAEP